ncbi:MAG: hypothetical protein HY326_09925, partial [Chloroflexi bacterium]|nr:hypothetical protein [Chloroflexota bacterium]
ETGIEFHDWYIFKIELATGVVTQLTTGRTDIDFVPCWRPDGKILFLSARDPYRYGSDIYVMNPDGSGQTMTVGSLVRNEEYLDWR